MDRHKLTLKQEEEKNDLRSPPTTFSMNRLKGRMCDVGAVLTKKRKGNQSSFSGFFFFFFQSVAIYVVLICKEKRGLLHLFKVKLNCNMCFILLMNLAWLDKLYVGYVPTGRSVEAKTMPAVWRKVLGRLR